MDPTTATALARYGKVQITTCSPGELLIMLYDGLFRFLGEAAQHTRSGDRKRAGERISRCHAILEQLLTGLDPSKAPELCERLDPLYRFCMHRLVEANLHRDASRIDDVARILAPLRDAWRKAVQQVAAASTLEHIAAR